MSPQNQAILVVGWLATATTSAVAARIDLDITPAARGGRGEVTAVLREAPGGVDGVSTELYLPPGLRFAETSLGEPECTTRCALDGGASKDCFLNTATAFRPRGCDPARDCTGVWFLAFDLGGGGAIPDGGQLLRCTLAAAPDVAPGRYPVTCAAQVSRGEEALDAPCGGELAVVCEGDCDGDGRVVVGELVRGINLALRVAGAPPCTAIDRNGDGRVAITEIIRARANFLNGCDYVPPPPPPTATPTPGPIAFAAPLHFPAGPYPVELALADLDGDAAVDLVVPLQPDYRPFDVRSFPVAILTGVGDGTFAAPAQFRVGNTPVDVVVADLDGDARPDIATANFNVPFSASVLLGQPTGGFAPHVPYAAGDRPSAIAAADLDADGAVDLAVANRTSRDLSIFYGTGDGTFVPPTTVATCGGADVALADVDGDGRVDAIAAGESGVCVHLNDGGTLQAPADVAGSGGSRVAAADLDGDGAVDLAVLSRQRQRVSLLANDGDAGFRELWAEQVDGDPNDLAAADLDGDGRLDLATANRASRDVALWLNRGPGRFTVAHRVPVGPYALPVAVAAGDVDGDGRTDLLTANLNSDDVTVLLGRADGSGGDP